MTRRVPCLRCGTPITATPCPACGFAPGSHDDPEYRANAAIVRTHAVGKTCRLCGKQIKPGEAIAVDHVVPNANGGGHNLGNLAATHATCNKQRGDR